MNDVRRKSRSAAPEPVMRTAGAWLARRDRGFTAVELAAFERWRASHPSHAAAVAQLEQTMTAFDALPLLAPAEAITHRPDPDVFAPSDSSRAKRHRLLAACTATILAAAAALALLIALPKSDRPERVERFAAAAGNVDRVTLTDGSTVLLNRDTEIAVEFERHERRVRLMRGEAHFQVTKNPARPFVVLAGTVRAQAVGTAFNVRLDGEAVEVLVTEGRVKVAAASSPEAASTLPPRVIDAPLLPAGFRARFPLVSETPVPQVVQLEPEEIARRLAWQPPLVDLSNAPLSQVVAELNRRSALNDEPQIVIADAALRNLRLGGTLHPSQPELFVRLLEKSFAIRAERSGDTIALHSAR